MSYFPLFLNFNHKKVLLIGAGKIAYEKLVHLLDFTKDITIIAKTFNKDIEKLIKINHLEYIQKEYSNNDIEPYDIIIVAIDDIILQKSIYIDSMKYKCLCNCVDLLECCDFIFPSYIKKDNLIIAISTSGTSPAFAKHLKQYLNNIIPNSVVAFLKEMKNLRKTLPKGKERMYFLNKKAQNYIKKWDNKSNNNDKYIK